QRARDAHPLVAHVGAGLPPQRQRRLVAEIDADLLEDGHRLLVDQLDAVGIEQLVERDLAGDVALLDQRRAGLGRPPAGGAAPPCRDLAHGPSSSGVADGAYGAQPRAVKALAALSLVLGRGVLAAAFAR